MAEGKILPYLDIPFQHASPRILKDMRRPAHAEKVLERLGKWREQCPEIAVRSTFIVGFPGETEDDFETLLDFLEEAQLDRVGAFAYSPVDGAPANDLPGAVPEEVKEERLERFMELQAEISANKLSTLIGKTMKVLVDEAGDGVSIARSYRDAPEIDGEVIIEGVELPVGEFVKVMITHADEHDLWAERIA
jgi:ribosomal protein S12 methylthiotransferase